MDDRVHLEPRIIVKGTRITLEDILMYLRAGFSPEEAAEELGIPLEAVEEAEQLGRAASRDKR